MDSRHAFSSLVHDSTLWGTVTPYWRRLFGGFSGLPATVAGLGLVLFMIDCWLFDREGNMSLLLCAHVALTVGLATVFSLTTIYLIKRRQCQMRLVRLPRTRR